MFYHNYGEGINNGQVAAAALEALKSGITFDDLIKNNTIVSRWWNKYSKEITLLRKKERAEKARRAKARAEKKLKEEKIKQLVATFSVEELEALGFSDTGKKSRSTSKTSGLSLEPRW